MKLEDFVWVRVLSFKVPSSTCFFLEYHKRTEEGCLVQSLEVLSSPLPSSSSPPSPRSIIHFE